MKELNKQFSIVASFTVEPVDELEGELPEVDEVDDPDGDELDELDELDGIEFKVSTELPYSLADIAKHIEDNAAQYLSGVFPDLDLEGASVICSIESIAVVDAPIFLLD